MGGYDGDWRGSLRSPTPALSETHRPLRPRLPLPQNHRWDQLRRGDLVMSHFYYLLGRFTSIETVVISSRSCSFPSGFSRRSFSFPWTFLTRSCFFLWQPMSKKVITREEWERKLKDVKIRKEDMNKLVMNFLVTEGYVEAAEKFRVESGTERILPHCFKEQRKRKMISWQGFRLCYSCWFSAVWFGFPYEGISGHWSCHDNWSHGREEGAAVGQCRGCDRES